MRCKKCGWPNKPNETNCIKCGAPLISDDDSNISMDADVNKDSSNSLSETVMEDEAFKPDQASRKNKTVEESVSEVEEVNNPCPKCGYPLRPGIEKCPNCKYQISGAVQSSYSPVTETTRKNNMERRPTRMDMGNAGRGGTVNPYLMNVNIEPSFVLKPVKRMNERHDFDDLEFKGKTIMLHRDNTEKDNPSITSREQAILTNVDGRWFIEDRSEQKTTFVQAANRIELNDGDLILLGNRLFEFHE